LLEPFQWLTEEQSSNLPPEARAAVEEELADVLLYLVRLADKLDVDLEAAARAKIVRNAAKYPVEKSRGSSANTTRCSAQRPKLAAHAATVRTSSR